MGRGSLLMIRGVRYGIKTRHGMMTVSATSADVTRIVTNTRGGVRLVMNLVTGQNVKTAKLDITWRIGL
jgi:hypothetical protein